MKSKVVSLAEAISLVPNGATVALGGHTLRRHPMAAVAEIVRQRKRELHLLGWNSGIDVDLLVGAGCARIVETSYVGISGFGLARNYRRAAELGEIEIREHSEISALDMFRAGSMGIPFMASSVLRGTDVPATNPRIATVTSPFYGSRVHGRRGRPTRDRDHSRSQRGPARERPARCGPLARQRRGRLHRLGGEDHDRDGGAAGQRRADPREPGADDPSPGCRHLRRRGALRRLSLRLRQPVHLRPRVDRRLLRGLGRPGRVRRLPGTLGVRPRTTTPSSSSCSGSTDCCGVAAQGGVL